jgi:protoheme IX farnesyltransferase
MKGIIKDYYRLAKPGIIYGNLITTIAAFLFASAWHVNIVLLLSTIIGLGLVIGSACVFNNYLDRDIDKNMTRTKDRALVTGRISLNAARIYGVVLGSVGFALLILYVNFLTAVLAYVLGFFWYTVIYTYGKRKTHWAALLGTIPGAVPILVGYTAVTNHIDLTAILLFLILVFWQMPHFYGIALYRLNEYKAAGVPVFPATKGIRATKRHMIGFIFLYAVVTIAFASLAKAGITYLVIVLAFGSAWLYRALKGYDRPEEESSRWGRELFLFSLITLLTFCAALAASPLLP